MVVLTSGPALRYQKALLLSSPDGETVDLVLGQVADEHVAELHVIAVHFLQGLLQIRKKSAAKNATTKGTLNDMLIHNFDPRKLH